MVLHCYFFKKFVCETNLNRIVIYTIYIAKGFRGQISVFKPEN